MSTENMTPTIAEMAEALIGNLRDKSIPIKILSQLKRELSPFHPTLGGWQAEKPLPDRRCGECHAELVPTGPESCYLTCPQGHGRLTSVSRGEFTRRLRKQPTRSHKT